MSSILRVKSLSEAGVELGRDPIPASVSTPNPVAETQAKRELPIVPARNSRRAVLGMAITTFVLVYVFQVPPPLKLRYFDTILANAINSD
jgi:hypothetical protein